MPRAAAERIDNASRTSIASATGAMVKERHGAERAPDRLGRSADSATADGSVPIEIGIGEAAGAPVGERRDAHVVARGRMRGDAR